MTFDIHDTMVRQLTRQRIDTDGYVSTDTAQYTGEHVSTDTIRYVCWKPADGDELVAVLYPAFLQMKYDAAAEFDVEHERDFVAGMDMYVKSLTER